MATNQNRRLLAALRPESAALEDRSVADLLVFAARFGRLIHYYDASNRRAGDWAPLFENEPLVQFALIAATDLNAHRELCEHWTRPLGSLAAAEGDGLPRLEISDAAVLRSAIGSLLRLCSQIDHWHRQLVRHPEERAFVATLRRVIRETFAPIRLGVRTLLEVLRAHDPDAARVASPEERDLEPAIWGPQAAHASDRAMTEEERPERWSTMASLLSRYLHDARRGEEEVVEAARTRLALLLESPGRVRPHLAVYLAFARQLGHLQAAANDIPRRHLDYFYREILRDQPRPPVADRTFLVLELKPPGGRLTLPAGTRVTGPAVGSTPAPAFVTETALELSDCRLQRGMIVRLDSAATAPHDPSLAPASAPAAVRAAEAGIQESPPRFGFALGSPYLALAGGERRIAVRVEFRSPPPAPPDPSGKTPDQRTRNLNPPPCAIAYSGAAAWVPVPPAQIESVVLKYLDAPRPEPMELSLTFRLEAFDPAVADFDPAVLPGDYAAGHPVLQVLFPQPLAAFGSDPPGTARPAVPAFARALVRRITIDVSVVRQPVRSLDNQLGRLAVEQPFAPFGGQPRVGNALVLGAGELFRKTFTDLRVELEWFQLPEPKRFPYGLRSYYREYIQFAAESGLIQPAEEGYDALADSSNLFQAQAYRVTPAYLARGRWTDWPGTDGPTPALFQPDGDRPLGPVTVIRSPPEVSFNPTPEPHLASAAGFSPDATNGFLRLTLAGPEYAFGHAVFPKVAAAVAAHNGRLGAKTASAAPETLDPMRITHQRSLVGRILHLTGGAEYYTLPDPLFAALHNAGAPPEELAALARQFQLDPTRWATQLRSLEGTHFNHDAALDDRVARVLELDRAKLEDRDRQKILAMVYGWFHQLLEEQREMTLVVNSLSERHVPSLVHRVLNPLDRQPMFTLAEDIFTALARKPVPTGPLADALRTLNLNVAGYANLLSMLRGRTFRNAAHLGALVLHALPLAPQTAGQFDRNHLLRLTFEWFTQLTQRVRPIQTDDVGISPNPAQRIPLPNPPLTPMLSRVTLSYRAQTTLGEPTSPPTGTFYHVEPVGITPRTLAGERGSPLLPPTEPGTWLYLGFAQPQPAQDLTLLFVPPAARETPGPAPSPATSWSLLRDDDWNEALARASIADGTQGLTRAGLIELRVPEAPAGSPFSRDGLLWLRVGFPDPAVPLAGLSLSPGAVIARRVLPGNGAETATPAPEGTPMDLTANVLNQLQPPHPRVARVRQPLPSFGGRAAENDQTFRIRVSERLRHKGRAWTAWDYERVLLEEYPEIFCADCLGPDPGDPTVPPGSVLIVVFPTVKQPPEGFPPVFSPTELASIEAWLRERASPSLEIRVRNPDYRPVRARAEIRFNLDDSVAHQLARLNADLRAEISPWLYRQATAGLPERELTPAALAAYVDALPYVDGLLRFELIPVGAPTSPPPTPAALTLIRPAGTAVPGSGPARKLIPDRRSEYFVTVAQHELTAA